MDTAGELHRATLLNQPPAARASAIFMVDQFKNTLDLDVLDVIATAIHRLFGGHPHAMNRVASHVWSSLCGSRDLFTVTDLWKGWGIEIIKEEKGYYEIVNQNAARPHSPVSD